MTGQAQVCLCVLLATAVIMDIRFCKIKNQLIFIGFLFGIIGRRFGWMDHSLMLALLGMCIPFICLFILLQFRMLGAGDIKLLCMIGFYTGLHGSIWCMCGAFVAGAVISLCKMLWNRNLIERFAYLGNYVKRGFLEKRFEPYGIKNEKNSTIHFSIPIFISTMLYLGGLLT